MWIVLKTAPTDRMTTSMALLTVMIRSALGIPIVQAMLKIASIPSMTTVMVTLIAMTPTVLLNPRAPSIVYQIWRLYEH